MVKALFFDLTDTLQEFNWEKQWDLLCPELNKQMKSNLPDKEIKKKYQQVYEFYRLGLIKTDYFFFDILLKQLGFAPTKAQIKYLAKFNLKIRSQFTWLPADYEKTLLLLRNNFKIACVSSGVAPWGYYDFKELFGFKFKKHFDLVIFSSEQGYLKESGKLFEIALKNLKVKPSQVAYVGNSYIDDVLLAKRFGMKAVFLNKNHENKGIADFEIKSLAELTTILPDLIKT